MKGIWEFRQESMAKTINLPAVRSNSTILWHFWDDRSPGWWENWSGYYELRNFYLRKNSMNISRKEKLNLLSLWLLKIDVLFPIWDILRELRSYIYKTICRDVIIIIHLSLGYFKNVWHIIGNIFSLNLHMWKWYSTIFLKGKDKTK